MTKSFSLRSAQTVAVLSITQIISWGTSFDMLGAMGRIIAPDLGLSNEIVFAGLTVMMLITGLVSPAIGRALARHGAARVLTASSITFAIGLLLLAAASGLVLYTLAWLVMGLAGAMGLSAPAYAAVVEREGLNGKRIITIMMLFTGLSTTLAWPILTLLDAYFGWRATFLICAGLHLFVSLPLYLFALPKPIAAAKGDAGHHAAPIPLSAAGRRKAFVLIAAATTISTFVTFGLSPSMLEIFRQYGASPALALQLGSARGVIGISARLMDMLLGRRGNPILSAGHRYRTDGDQLRAASRGRRVDGATGDLHPAVQLRRRRHGGGPGAAAAGAVFAGRIRPAFGAAGAAAEPCQRHRAGGLHRHPRPRQRSDRPHRLRRAGGAGAGADHGARPAGAAGGHAGSGGGHRLKQRPTSRLAATIR
ncbi:MAG: MFS transporter [Pantoea sp.]|uniref:MFS transporter n=1 Tax=Pantoea sp. TaxID=69393 RepID=UPI0023A0D117|nr:MFS transporter [Pantoea sp.]MDE1186269.1 MFS transporter [Pantoea sp.]